MLNQAVLSVPISFRGNSMMGVWKFRAKIKFLVLFVVLVTAVSPQSCFLEDSTEHSYLIRIVIPAEPRSELYSGVTIAHGSLIRVDKVLSTCVQVEPNDLLAGKYRLIGHNAAKKCLQTRNTSQFDRHPDCFSRRRLEQFDFALWTPSEPFDVDGTPFLWKAAPAPAPALIEYIINDMNHGGGDLRFAIFAKKFIKRGSNSTYQFEEPLLAHGTFPFARCKRVVSDEKTHSNFGNRTYSKQHHLNFFCGSNMGAIGMNHTHALRRDWYTGAVVKVDLHVDRLPIGLVSLRTAGRGLNLMVAFSDEFYSFLNQSIGSDAIYPMEAPDKKCKLQHLEKFPYMLRIIRFSYGRFETAGHGSLVRIDKVLTTCSRYRHLPVRLREEPHWQIWGYNNIKRCTAKRQPSKIIKHPDCLRTPLVELLAHDFAIWSPTEDFEVVGPAALWGPEHPLSITGVVSNISNNFRELQMMASMPCKTWEMFGFSAKFHVSNAFLIRVLADSFDC